MLKLAIIGASYLQLPLIVKAKEMGLETHVFAWAANDVGEREADYFYPISITEKEKILDVCREIGISGVCSIASDLAMLTVNYIAEQMGLTANSMDATYNSTNKHRMRECFFANGDPSPKSMQVTCVEDLGGVQLTYPVIVKPVDRSGSRGITKLESEEGLKDAIENAKDQGFIKEALVEEFAEGQEYSVEYISWKSEHHFLTLTKKFTTGAPHFIETGHLEPAPVDSNTLNRIKSIVPHALDSLGLAYGASHTEVKIDDKGNIRIIEIGGRMGGDCIGSSLVQLSTGVDFVKAVIEVALGKEPQDITPGSCGASAIRFVFTDEDIKVLEEIEASHPELIVEKNIQPFNDREVTDSSSRFGYYILKDKTIDTLQSYMP